MPLERIAPGAGIATLGNVFAVLLTNPPGPSTVYALKRRVVDFAATQPAGIGYLHVISPGDTTGLPSAEARRAFGEMAAAVRGQVRAVALVFDQVGFRAVAVRAIAAGVLLAGRVSHPTHVAATVSDGAVWLAKTIITPVTATQMTEAVAQLRRL